MNQPLDTTNPASPECCDPEGGDPEGGDPEVPLAWDQFSLRGRGLRFILVNELMGRESMTVAELVVALNRHGYPLAGRASKIISDALRWELRRNRVRRLSRGVYCYLRAPVSTARRIRLFAARCHQWIVAMTRTGQPLPYPPPRPGVTSRTVRLPNQPPWSQPGWLWAT